MGIWAWTDNRQQLDEIGSCPIIRKGLAPVNLYQLVRNRQYDAAKPERRAREKPHRRIIKK
jgi:hypothetical protein